LGNKLLDSPTQESQDVAEDDYSLIEHLVRSIRFSDDWRELGVVMLSAYYDRSEYPDEPHILSVAGYLSHVKIWKDFDREWKEFLNRPEFNVAYFHMKEFTVSQGVFANGWKGERQKRKDFLAGLIEIIGRNTSASFSVAVRVQEFWEVMAEFPIHPECPLASPYAYCGWQCVEKAKTIALKDGYRLPIIQSFFDDGEEDEGMLKGLLKWAKHPVPIFKPKVPRGEWQESDCLRPLQAADLAAWESTKFTRTADTAQDLDWEDVRVSFRELMRHPPAYWGLIQKNAIRDHVAQYVNSGYLGEQK